ncbi:CHRD domain-containing protein [Sphingomonas tabacisoli]|uniref:CHRD domain-containing protein n=1 Tax=Sphingomonas tabacisoli TaxID=2249466 RepID=A0ABW4I797_9SPHN
MIRPILVLLTAGLALVGAQASAAVIVYSAALRASNEVPPAASPGTGSATVTVNDVTNMMRVQVSFSGLVGTTTASHIHCCQALGTNAQVATTTPTFPNFPLGVTSGTYDQTFDLTQASSYNPAFVTAHGGNVTQARTDFLAGLAATQAYLNIHTSLFPGGEIRGQLFASVPEPASWALMIAGFGLAGGVLRSRPRALRTTA